MWHFHTCNKSISERPLQSWGTDTDNTSRSQEIKTVYCPESIKCTKCALFKSFPAYLWGVGLNRRAALCSTVQGKVNKRLSVGKGHLVDEGAHDINAAHFSVKLRRLWFDRTSTWSRGSVLEKGLRSCATPFLFPLRTPFSMSCNVNTSPPIR